MPKDAQCTADAETDDLLIASESVPVSYNTPEYDIEVNSAKQRYENLYQAEILQGWRQCRE